MYIHLISFDNNILEFVVQLTVNSDFACIFSEAAAHYLILCNRSLYLRTLILIY